MAEVSHSGGRWGSSQLGTFAQYGSVLIQRREFLGTVLLILTAIPREARAAQWFSLPLSKEFGPDIDSVQALLYPRVAAQVSLADAATLAQTYDALLRLVGVGLTKTTAAHALHASDPVALYDSLCSAKHGITPASFEAMCSHVATVKSLDLALPPDLRSGRNILPERCLGVVLPSPAAGPASCEDLGLSAASALFAPTLNIRPTACRLLYNSASAPLEDAIRTGFSVYHSIGLLDRDFAQLAHSFALSLSAQPQPIPLEPMAWRFDPGSSLRSLVDALPTRDREALSPLWGISDAARNLDTADFIRGLLPPAVSTAADSVLSALAINVQAAASVRRPDQGANEGEPHRLFDAIHASVDVLSALSQLTQSPELRRVAQVAGAAVELGRFAAQLSSATVVGAKGLAFVAVTANILTAAVGIVSMLAEIFSPQNTQAVLDAIAAVGREVEALERQVAQSFLRLDQQMASVLEGIRTICQKLDAIHLSDAARLQHIAASVDALHDTLHQSRVVQISADQATVLNGIRNLVAEYTLGHSLQEPFLLSYLSSAFSLATILSTDPAVSGFIGNPRGEDTEALLMFTSQARPTGAPITRTTSISQPSQIPVEPSSTPAGSSTNSVPLTARTAPTESISFTDRPLSRVAGMIPWMLERLGIRKPVSSGSVANPEIWMRITNTWLLGVMAIRLHRNAPDEALNANLAENLKDLYQVGACTQAHMQALSRDDSIARAASHFAAQGRLLVDALVSQITSWTSSNYGQPADFRAQYFSGDRPTKLWIGGTPPPFTEEAARLENLPTGDLPYTTYSPPSSPGESIHYFQDPVNLAWRMGLVAPTFQPAIRTHEIIDALPVQFASRKPEWLGTLQAAGGGKVHLETEAIPTSYWYSVVPGTSICVTPGSRITQTADAWGFGPHTPDQPADSVASLGSYFRVWQRLIANAHNDGARQLGAWLESADIHSVLKRWLDGYEMAGNTLRTAVAVRTAGDLNSLRASDGILTSTLGSASAVVSIASSVCRGVTKSNVAYIEQMLHEIGGPGYEAEASEKVDRFHDELKEPLFWRMMRCDPVLTREEIIFSNQTRAPNWLEQTVLDNLWFDVQERLSPAKPIDPATISPQHRAKIIQEQADLESRRKLPIEMERKCEIGKFEVSYRLWGKFKQDFLAGLCNLRARFPYEALMEYLPSGDEVPPPDFERKWGVGFEVAIGLARPEELSNLFVDTSKGTSAFPFELLRAIPWSWIRGQRTVESLVRRVVECFVSDELEALLPSRIRLEYQRLKTGIGVADVDALSRVIGVPGAPSSQADLQALLAEVKTKLGGHTDRQVRWDQLDFRGIAGVAEGGKGLLWHCVEANCRELGDGVGLGFVGETLAKLVTVGEVYGIRGPWTN